MIITSPVSHFPGTVERPDSLTLEQAIQIENMLAEVQARRDKIGRAELDRLIIGAILPHFSGWAISGLPAAPTPETYPGSPRNASAQLTAWLLTNIMAVYTGETTIPNA